MPALLKTFFNYLFFQKCLSNCTFNKMFCSSSCMDKVLSGYCFPNKGLNIVVFSLSILPFFWFEKYCFATER